MTETRAWRHVKRGTVYTEIGRAELQNAWDAPLADGSEIVIYRGEDGKLWARQRAEFEDGRFEPCPPPAVPCADEVEALFPVADAARSKHLRVDPNDQMGALGGALEAALAELAHLRQAERERAWLAGAEATRSALAGYAEARGARALAYCLREFPLPPMGGV